MLLNLCYNALDVRVSLIFELSDVLCCCSHLIEMHRAQRSADISAEQVDGLCFVSVGYGAHVRMCAGVRPSA